MQTTTIKTKNGKTISIKGSYLLQLVTDEFHQMIETYQGSPLHCESGPALVCSDGTELYFCDGIRLTQEQFRERIKLDTRYYQLPNGAKQRVWKSKQTDKIHRPDGPAIETSDGSYTSWMINGQLHRVGAPALTIVSNNSSEEQYYYYGKLHNPDGPAKINLLTNRNSYYINGKRLSKSEFMNRQKSRHRMRAAVNARIAYQTYMHAWNTYNQALSSRHAGANFIEKEIITLIGAIKNAKTIEERRAFALGIYHAVSSRYESRVMASAEEFACMHEEVNNDMSSNIFFFNDDTPRYEVYLSAFLLSRCDTASIFSSVADDDDIIRIFQKAAEDAAINEVPDTEHSLNRFMTAGYSTSSEGDFEQSSRGVDEEIFSWTLPLAIAAGVGMLSQMYKKNSSAKKKIVKEKACTVPARKM